jgi:glucose-6-phosphate isomerase
MHLEYFNTPEPAKLDPHILPKEPEFISYSPDFKHIQEIVLHYRSYKNILIIGHGGSITSFYAIAGILRQRSKRETYFLSTIDPDTIFEYKAKLSPHETLVISVSKSGSDTTQVEAVMQFINYPLLFIAGKDSPEAVVAQKLGAPLINHPLIGGRFSAFTEATLLPALICGLDAKDLYVGSQEMHKQYAQDNMAWKAASILFQLEEQGYIDVFLPIYSHNLFSAANLITQLCHESFGKNQKGQTYFAAEAPESQHHTNQRFFGGRKNVAGFILSTEQFDHPTINTVPTSLHSVQFKNQALVALNKIPLETGMAFERQGVLDDARLRGIPTLHLSINGFNETEVGRLLAFWQLYAVYASILRDVDPFDQPEVENSKRLSFDKRLQFKGML